MKTSDRYQDATLRVRVTNALRDNIEEAACYDGMSISEWIRHALRSELRKHGERRNPTRRK